MIVHDVAQRSEAWHALRCGRFCASDAADMLAKIKTGEAAARRDLRLRLVVERLTGHSQDDGYLNAAIQRGIDKEPDARRAYEALTGNLVSEVGFVSHDTLKAGASPDGTIDTLITLVEIKTPKSATHLGYLRAGTVPTAYLPQLTHQLWITGAEAVDFFSWDDRMPEGLQTFLVRFHRAEADLAAYELAARLFLDECDREHAAVAALAFRAQAVA